VIIEKISRMLQLRRRSLIQLLKADVGCVLPEALATHVEPVLADHAVTVGTHATAA